MDNKYNYIINPKTKRKVKVKSKLGKSLIESYKKELIGGAKCQISDYLEGDEINKKKDDLKKYIDDQQRYFNSLSILADKRNIERLLLISELKHLFNGLKIELEEQVNEFEEALEDCDKETMSDKIFKKFISIKFNQKTRFLSAKNKFLIRVQTFLQDKEALARNKVQAFIEKLHPETDRSSVSWQPNLKAINENNKKINELEIKKNYLLNEKKKKCSKDLIDKYYFSVIEKSNLLKFLLEFYDEINDDSGRQLTEDKIKIEKELCIPTTKIYRVPIDTTEDIRKKYRYAGEMDGALSSNKDGSLDYRTYSVNETINRLKKAAIDPERINDLDYFENIKLLIAKDFFGDEFKPFESEECAKKCRCSIDIKAESQCFGKVWSKEAVDNINTEHKEYKESNKGHQVYKEEIDTLMEKLQN